MLRRQSRLRKEYLYRKSLEAKERAIFDRKQQIKEALAENKELPTELQKEGEALAKQLAFDEAETAAPTSHVDDEYARAGVKDPKILITTSHEPSTRLKQFTKEMRSVIPNSQRINRGTYVIEEIVKTCQANDVTDLVIFHESKGKPDGMIVSHMPYGPTVYFTLYNVVLRHDIPDVGSVSEAFPHLIFNNFNTKLGERIGNVLKYLFPVPKADSKRVMTFANDNDFISFRHHVFQKVSHKEVLLAEVGPRFEMRPYEIRLGTVDLKHADTEWVLRPYQRTARKREQL
ncbi:snoRNA-binding rRNA-processing protein imp4 [Dispira parvispora]|uniref:U3 small nucleolar ribonucleoprotein protein IMP4 n=1 Tax=Dispira parvispora TaxID=1520584 RepID=A0A9W8E2J9_9FUNG|nr:snoRNA-binding rRNA-processing protein imp4 [Dispira parvispora]